MKNTNFINKIKEIVEPAHGPILDIVSDLFVPEIVEGIAKSFVPVVAAEIVGEVAGSFVPGVSGMIMSYKQARFEKNIEKMISELIHRMDDFNLYYEKLDDKIAIQVKTQYFAIMADHAAEVTQEDKMKFIVNGYINLIKDGHPQEDVVMMYYDTLDELTLLDIRVLKLYKLSLNDDRDNFTNIWQDYQIDSSQTNLIREKLSRLGLIEKRNEADYDKLFENVKNIIEFIENAEKNKRNNRLRTSHLTSFKSNQLTNYGRRFLQFFDDTEK